VGEAVQCLPFEETAAETLGAPRITRKPPPTYAMEAAGDSESEARRGDHARGAARSREEAEMWFNVLA